MKSWTLGIYMLILFALVSQTGRLALEIALSVVFITAFFLTLMREIFERNQQEAAESAEKRSAEPEPKETPATNSRSASEEKSDDMPVAA